MIIYHASLSQIKSFNFNENGVHFGGLLSAYEAALRKCNNSNEKIYLYECFLSENLFYISEDMGSHENWRDIIFDAKIRKINIIKYKNKYEPDVKPSFIVLKKGIVKIIKVSIINANDAEQEILNNIFL